ncbi:alpha/beta hydrolase [Nocardia sp. NPDC055321]
MFHRGPAFTAVTALLTAVLCTGATAAATTELSGTIAIPCAAGVLEQDTAWYLPDGEPTGLIWLQHGFARTNANVAALATAFADAGYLVFAPSLPFMNFTGCTLQNLGDNTAFLRNVTALFGGAGDATGPLAASLADAARRAQRPAPALPTDLVFIGHSAGAEAVLFVADLLRALHPETWTALRGLVLLDPVRSFIGDNIDRALTSLDATRLPVLSISAPPSACNSLGLGTLAVRTRLHRPFVGVELQAGAHTDAEGDSSDLLGELLCGTPSAVNATAVRTLALAWTHDYMTGTNTSDYYPATAGAPIAAAPTARVLTGS